MKKEKNFYEFQQVTWDKLFIRINKSRCHIQYINISPEDDEESRLEMYCENSVSIPVEFLPDLEEAIADVLIELKEKDLKNDDLNLDFRKIWETRS